MFPIINSYLLLLLASVLIFVGISNSNRELLHLYTLFEVQNMIYFQRKVFKCSAKNQNNMRVACPMPEKSRYSVQIFVTKPKCPKSCVRNFLNIWDSLEVWSSLRQSCYNHTASFPPAAALRIRIPFQIRSSIRMLPPA